MNHHAIIQPRSKMAVATKAPRQLTEWPSRVICEYCGARNESEAGTRQAALTRMNGRIHGTSTPPMFVPELNNPVARARSLLGNHSAVALIAAGKLPPSPRPSRMRHKKK